MKRERSKTSVGAQVAESIRWMKRTRVEGIRIWGLDANAMGEALQVEGIEVPRFARKEPDVALRTLTWLERAVIRLVAAYKAKGAPLVACPWCTGRSPAGRARCPFCAADAPGYVSGVRLDAIDRGRVAAVLQELLADPVTKKFHDINLGAAKKCQPRKHQPPKETMARWVFSLAMVFRTSTSPAQLAGCSRCGGETPAARGACAFCGGELVARESRVDVEWLRRRMPGPK